MAVQVPIQDGAQAPLLLSTFLSVPSISPTSSLSGIPQATVTYDSKTARPDEELLDALSGSTTASISLGEVVTDDDSDRYPKSSGHFENELTAAVSDTPNSLTTNSIFQQMRARTRGTIIFLSSLIAYVSVNSLVRAINPSAFIWCEEDRDEDQWVASSHSWLDRKACRWLGLCGLAHYKVGQGRFGNHRSDNGAQTYTGTDDLDWRHSWTSGTERPELWSRKERRLRHIPDYVLQYAPLVHLSSDEQFWPCDIAEHLNHVTPHLNYTPVKASWDHPTLRDLDKLNSWNKGRHVFLTSNDDVESRPPWLEGKKNIPVPVKAAAGEQREELDDEDDDWLFSENEDISDGGDPLHLQNRGDPETEGMSSEEARLRMGLSDQEPLGGSRKARKGGRSDAPAVLVVIDKGDGIVDAFWFYFYSFNLGNMVFNIRFGNHVGDWEHSLVRFQHGKPKAVFFSAHAGGEAYNYEAVEKIGIRVSDVFRYT